MFIINMDVYQFKFHCIVLYALNRQTDERSETFTKRVASVLKPKVKNSTAKSGYVLIFKPLRRWKGNAYYSYIFKGILQYSDF